MSNARYAGKRSESKVAVEHYGINGNKISRKSALRGNGVGRPSDLVKERARGSFARRVAILENIADGKTGSKRKTRTKNGELEETYIEATPSDRLKAMAMLAKYGGLDAELAKTESENLLDEVAAARALTSVLSDPSVRKFLAQEYPELLTALHDPDEIVVEAEEVEEEDAS